jgi:hypothetical protein
MLDYRKGDVSCRKCGHMLCHHALYVQIHQGGMVQSFIKIVDMVPCDSYDHTQTGMRKCGCVDYQPMDNLEYLEHKAQEAEQKRLEQDKDSW